jgi:hypothetical protein
VAWIRRGWSSGRGEVINQLADCRQAVLHLQVWDVSDRGIFWQRHDMLD